MMPARLLGLPRSLVKMK